MRIEERYYRDHNREERKIKAEKLKCIYVNTFTFILQGGKSPIYIEHRKFDDLNFKFYYILV